METFFSSGSNVSRINYFRLMALGSLDIFVTLPFGILNLVIPIRGTHDLVFWPGWADDSGSWGAQSISASSWKTSHWSLVNVRLNEWLVIFYAVVFLALFGFTEEARTRYRRALRAIRESVGLGVKLQETPLGTEKPEILFAPYSSTARRLS